MHLSSYHAAPADPMRVAQAEARAAQAACRRAEQQLDEMKDAYRQAGDREHVLTMKVDQLQGELNRRDLAAATHREAAERAAVAQMELQGWRWSTTSKKWVRRSAV